MDTWNGVLTIPTPASAPTTALEPTVDAGLTAGPWGFAPNPTRGAAPGPRLLSPPEKEGTEKNMKS